MARILERVKDYFEMGVPQAWIVNPVSLEGWVATPGRLEQAAEGILRADHVEMPLAEVLE